MAPVMGWKTYEEIMGEYANNNFGDPEYEKRFKLYSKSLNAHVKVFVEFIEEERD